MIASLLCVIACVFLYCCKGGQHGPLRRYFGRLMGIIYIDNQPIRLNSWTIWQRIYNRLSDGKPFSAAGFGFLALAGAPPGADTLVIYFSAVAGWLLAVSPSVGEEIGAVGGYKGGWGPYVSSKVLKTDPFGREYGVKKAFQRGVWLGTCLFIGLMPGSYVMGFLFVGFFYPLTIWLGVSIQQAIKGYTQVSWYIHEILFGIVLGIALAA